MPRLALQSNRLAPSMDTMRTLRTISWIIVLGAAAALTHFIRHPGHKHPELAPASSALTGDGFSAPAPPLHDGPATGGGQ